MMKMRKKSPAMSAFLPDVLPEIRGGGGAASAKQFSQVQLLTSSNVHGMVSFSCESPDSSRTERSWSCLEVGMQLQFSDFFRDEKLDASSPLVALLYLRNVLALTLIRFLWLPRDLKPILEVNKPWLREKQIHVCAVKVTASTSFKPWQR